MPLAIEYARRSNTQNRQVGAGEDLFLFLALDCTVYSGGSGTNLHFASYVRRRVWEHEFTGIVFPVIPLTSHRALLFGAPDSFPSGLLLNPVLVTGVAK